MEESIDYAENMLDYAEIFNQKVNIWTFPVYFHLFSTVQCMQSSKSIYVMFNKPLLN